MIELFTWPTPNGRKASIALEEFELDYEVRAVDITKDEQFAPSFLNISPNNKIPALVDHESGRTLMESGAILIYLADRFERFWVKIVIRPSSGLCCRWVELVRCWVKRITF